jgi:4-amino-4-deoxy-L-arabinose transferase-like glycosyltransferase
MKNQSFPISKFINNNKYFFLSIVLLSIFVGIVSIIILPEFPMIDAKTYDTIALNLIQENKYVPYMGHIITPLYPIFLASIYPIFGHSYTTIYFIQFLILGLMGIITYVICEKYYSSNRWISLLGALFVIFWPYMILFAKQLLTEILYSFLFLLFIWQLLKYFQKPQYRQAISMGVLVALAALTRPVIIFLPFWLLFFLIIWWITTRKKNNANLFNNYFKKSIITIIVFIIFCLPWIIYSSTIANKFILFTSNAGVMQGRTSMENVMKREWVIYGTPGFEPNSAYTIKKYAIVKIKNFFRFWETGADGTRAELLTNTKPLTRYLIIVYKISYYLILFLAFTSLYLWKKFNSIIILWLVILYFWLFHTAIYPLPRYTLPVIPLIIILAIISISNYKIL